MKVFLAGCGSRKELLFNEGGMKVFMAGEHPVKNGNKWKQTKHDIYLLESYYCCKNNKWFDEIYNSCKGFLLDSGAYTFMQDKDIQNWERYIKEYGCFINKHNIQQFFELDIDNIVGIKKVEDYRKQLEDITGKKSIPVWHKSRGYDYWLKMINDYEYVAIGGIVTREIKPAEYKYFNIMLKEAKEKNCRVHGLGFTRLTQIKKYPFYSVDSTAWLYGNRGGFLYYFDGSDIRKINRPKDTKLNSSKAAIHNFQEWVRFSEYMEKYYK